MTEKPYFWRFFRAGGFDQPRIDSAADLLAIGELDQKLWVALSCPVSGSEFDARTLALIDADGDGHIRAPELIAAVRWAGERLVDTAVLSGNPLTLAAIRSDDEEGATIAAAAREILAETGAMRSASLPAPRKHASPRRLPPPGKRPDKPPRYSAPTVPPLMRRYRPLPPRLTTGLPAAIWPLSTNVLPRCSMLRTTTSRRSPLA